MKVIERVDARRPLGDYAADMRGDTVVVTSQGRPVAALVPIENADMETVSLSTNPRFMALIERSRAQVRDEGSLSEEQMRRRFD